MRHIMVAASFLILGFSTNAIAQEEHVAFIKNLTGSVKIIRGKSDIVPVAGTQLMRSDKVVTGQDSSGGIVFKDGTRLALGSSTEIEISQYVFQPEAAKYEFSLYLKQGSAVYSSGKLGKLAPGAINLNTPRATVGVRGTRFIIKAD